MSAQTIHSRPAPGMVHATLEMPVQASYLITELAGEMGIDPGEVILRGIALLKAAHEAKSDGKAVGAALSPDALDTEFTGF